MAGNQVGNQIPMGETKLHIIVIIEVSGLSGLEVMLKSLFTNGKVVESQVPGERWRVLQCKISALPEVPSCLLGRSSSPSLLAPG